MMVDAFCVYHHYIIFTICAIYVFLELYTIDKHIICVALQ